MTSIVQPRARAPLALLPGRKGVFEVLRTRPERICRVFLREGIDLDTDFSVLLESCRSERQLRVVTMSKAAFDALDVGTHNQGVAAEVVESEYDEEKLFDELISTQGVLLICDQISDPQNLGALLRVAESAGAIGVLITKDRSADITPTVRKASVGASELIPIVRSKNLHRSLEQLKKRGVWILGTAIDQRSQSLYEAPRLRPVAVILGSEGEGMRRLSKESCDVLIEIPMRGVIQSLNVSQAASVLLYELTSPERVRVKDRGEK